LLICCLEAQMSEFIPWNQLVAHGVVGAAPEQTVQAVRTRLRQLGGHGQFNAPILIRLADGSIAPTSAAMLRRLAQERGAGILEERLERLLADLCPEPWAVEGQEAAEQEARRRGLPVIVTEGGQPAGLALPPGRLALIVPRDKGLFDLFDERLARQQLVAAEFVAARPSTPVAKVALDLKDLRDPRNAHLVVEMDDGSFRAMPIPELNSEVKRAGAGVWGLPVRRFASRLRRAERRQFTTIGHLQARAIADKENYLVVVDRGEVAGLIVSQVIRRGAEPYGAAAYEGMDEALAHDLHTVPQATLASFLSPAAPEAGPRFVNLWFEDGAQQAVAQSRPLVTDATYSLVLNVGRLRESSIVDWEQLPAHIAAVTEHEPVPIVVPKEEWPKLYASVFSRDFEIGQITQLLVLPPGGDSASVRFEARPVRRTFGEEDLATLDVCLYYRCNLVQSFQVQAEVLPEGGVPRTEKPQRAELKAARLEEYPDLDQIPEKEVNLTVTRRADGRYQFTFTLMPEAVQDPRWEAIRLGCAVDLRREDLTHLITKARRQLYNIARSTEYQSDMAGTPAIYRRSMKALATVGRQLYLKLFKLRDKDSAGAVVAQWMEENLTRDARVEIVDRAQDFVFPWALIYDRSPWDGAEVDPDGFWGVRYQIELLTDGLVKRYQEVTPVIETDQVSLGVGLYDYLPGAKQQRVFFDNLAEAAGVQIRTDLFNATPSLRRALESGDQHLLYFFCHGFTERMAADIQLSDDLLAEFKAASKGLAEKQRANLEEGDITHYDALFDVSDSWLQLTRGTAPLTMIEDTLLKADVRFRNGPLVFLNMCESAQVLPSLSGGFIPFFVDFGARGVVGTECPMTTTFADPFAQEFLRRFFEGQPVGRILLDLRREFLAKGNPLGLAYTLYCDADVRLASGIPEPAESEKGVTSMDEQYIRQLVADNMDNEQYELEQVFDELGRREAALAQGLTDEAANPDVAPAPPPDETLMGIGDTFADFGKRMWKKYEPQVYDMLCNPKNPKHGELMDALKEGTKNLAIMLVPALMAQLAALPAFVVVIATLVGKQIAKTGLEVACDMWAEARAEAAAEG
jgi:hypothetical protein